ncbi:molybdenum metabolism regulator [Priestia megaterium]|nr:molybdenum metabolism regulator [Priestia megaterium]
MKREEFWTFIERMAANEDPIEWAIATLANHEDSDIINFQLHVEQLLQEAFNSDVWGAAYVILGGASEDAFEHFRAWLIFQGENVFYETLRNPEYLATYIPPYYEEEGLEPEYEEILGISIDAYLLKYTGKSEWNEEVSHRYQELLKEKEDGQRTVEIEFHWENEEELLQHFPKLTERFATNPL